MFSPDDDTLGNLPFNAWLHLDNMILMMDVFFSFSSISFLIDSVLIEIEIFLRLLSEPLGFPCRDM